MDKRTARCKERSLRTGLPVIFILADRVVNRLGIVGLEFHRDHRNTVSAQYDVDGFVGSCVEADLTHDAQAYCVRGLGDVDQLRARRREDDHGTEFRGGATDLRIGEAGTQHAKETTHGFPCGRINAACLA